MDLRGFFIEYISPHNVFPWQHEIRVTPDGTLHLVDTRYAGRRMIDIVTDEERGGSVTWVLKTIDKAVVTRRKPDGSPLHDGSLILEVSPKDSSPTGLKQDNGSEIRYDDTHLKFSQVKGDKFIGFTVQTDLTKGECRELLYRASGKKLPKDAPVEDYIRAFAIIDPGMNNLNSIEDLVGVAEQVRSDLSFGSKNAFKDKTWDQVRAQIQQGDRLYDWTETSQAILKQFVRDVIEDNPSRDEVPEYIAATILRAVEAARIDEQTIQAGEIDQLTRAATKETRQEIYYSEPLPLTFGKILQNTAAIPGCAGGGSSSSSIETPGWNGIKVGKTTGESCPRISCPCGWVASDAEVVAVQAEIITRCPWCDSPPNEGSVEKRMQKEAALKDKDAWALIA